MDHIVHHASPSAIGQPYPAVSGNTYASRPTRHDPQACDCCNQPAESCDLSKTTTCFVFGELPSYVCIACAATCRANYPDGEPRELRIRWIIMRAGRFGQQWQDAVRAQLGWSV